MSYNVHKVDSTVATCKIISVDIRESNAGKMFEPIYECKCLCGKIFKRRHKRLERNDLNIASCSKECGMYYTSMKNVGKTFLGLKIIDIVKTQNKKPNYCIAVCKCLICNNEYKTSLSRVCTGVATSCSRSCTRIFHQNTKLNVCIKNDPLIMYSMIDRLMKIAIRGAKKRSLEFNISVEYMKRLFLEQHQKCAYLKTELYLGCKSGDIYTNASIDRIDSSKGYIEGNVQWVHKKVNIMKQDMTHENFLELCRLIAEANPI